MTWRSAGDLACSRPPRSSRGNGRSRTPTNWRSSRLSLLGVIENVGLRVRRVRHVRAARLRLLLALRRLAHSTAKKPGGRGPNGRSSRYNASPSRPRAPSLGAGFLDTGGARL